jgi:rubrerythrin
MKDVENECNDEIEGLAQIPSDNPSDAERFNLDYYVCDVCGHKYKGSYHNCPNKT